MRHRARWAPWWALLALGGLRGLTGELGLDLRTFALGGGLFAAWWIGRRLWWTGLLAALLLTPALAHLWIALPAASAALSAPQGTRAADYVLIDGTVRRQRAALGDGQAAMALLLGEATVQRAGRTWRLAELDVDLPMGQRWHRFHGRERIHIGGLLERGERAAGRLRLHLRETDYHFESVPIGRAEVLRTALADRAGYYLHHAAQAAYLPILLGIRERGTPEARAVVATFNRTGAAHLFAISGLHVGLLYLIFLLAAHHAVGLLLRGHGPRYLREGLQLGVIALIWVYLALIGFPVSAVRAAVMGTLFAWADLWGARTPRFHVLAVTALALLALTPSEIYDLSFQLSFLAYGCLLLAFPPHAVRAPPSGALLGVLRRAGQGMAFNLRMTLLIVLGTWPLVSAVFGTVSLLTFAANLLMIPLLSLVVLPCALVSLLTSLALLGAPPGHPLERLAFGVTELAIAGWLAIITAIDRWGGALVLRFRLDWPQPLVLAYYGLVAGLVWAWWRHRERTLRRGLQVGVAP
ncbi:MAG: ComEC/Rec2 family competence protein [Candidatus Lambdaproteobacteria bacterium]|nr:ComEC/Rec2 family competence protein [Candidatus Lambdaproteobacteria bacterium]